MIVIFDGNSPQNYRSPIWCKDNELYNNQTYKTYSVCDLGVMEKANGKSD